MRSKPFREQLIERIMKEGYDMFSACEEADRLIDEFKQSGKDRLTWYFRHSGKEIAIERKLSQS